MSEYLGPKTLLFGSLDPNIVPLYPCIATYNPLKGPYYLDPWTLRVVDEVAT